MNKNVGKIDRLIRIILSLSIGILYLAGIISGTTALILATLAIVFSVTSAVGSCPIYSVCNITTRQQSHTKL